MKIIYFENGKKVTQNLPINDRKEAAKLLGNEIASRSIADNDFRFSFTSNLVPAFIIWFFCGFTLAAICFIAFCIFQFILFNKYSVFVKRYNDSTLE